MSATVSGHATKRSTNLLACAVAVGSALIVVSPVGIAAKHGTESGTPWPGGQWEPAPASYAMAVVRDVPVVMNDGVILHANIGYPADLATQQRITGKFPVLLTQNPYAGGEKPDLFFVSRGYIHVVAEVRGTGNSQLSADNPDGPLASVFFARREGLDGARLVQWVAQGLDGSNGRVGLSGCSWLGINQILTAAEVGPRSPIKAIIPACTGFGYQTNFMGGVPVATILLAGTPSPINGPKHSADNAAAGAARRNNILSGGDIAYQGEYWQERNLVRLARRIVDNDIPALLWTGWNALEGVSGGIDLYSAFQNALQGRDVLGPMKISRHSRGRYQIIVGPGGHGQGIDKTIQLQWFDHWVKQQDTRIDRTPKGMHLFEIGADRWVNHSSWPMTDRYTSLYLSDGTLQTTPGAPHTTSVTFGPPTEPAATVTYEGTPLEADQSIAGPVSATLFIRSSVQDAHVIATLYDVAPDGSVAAITTGSLIASSRAIDVAASWFSKTDVPIKPEGRFIDSASITPGSEYRLDIEMFPTLRRVRAGHHLRFVITTQARPEQCTGMLSLTRPAPCVFTAVQSSMLSGGVYAVLSGKGNPAAVHIPFVRPESLKTAESATTPTSPNQTQPLDWD